MHGTIKASFRIEWRPFGALASIVPQWQALAAEALEPNVFYEPAFALAAAAVFGRGAGATLVWSSGSPARLIGLFPSLIEQRRYGVPLPMIVGWTHPYAPFGAPLVDARAPDAVLGAWLAHIRSEVHIPNLLLLPYFPAQGPLASALDAAIAQSASRSLSLNRHARALLAPASDRAGYVERSLGRRKLKELRRQMRRLGDAGTVSWRMASDPASLAPALSNFLRLEASGWKGRAGTAARENADIRRYMESAVLDLAAQGKVRIGSLLVETRAVASLILLRSRDTVWAWKIAYDESLARASPGVQLIVHSTKELLDDATVALVDSCAGPDHPMIDHVWRERLALTVRLIRVGPDGSAAFAAAATLEAIRLRAFAAARKAKAIFRP
jgi:CelD/BcsL family acetyltransferase involved in cellulose biosynthesis